MLNSKYFFLQKIVLKNVRVKQRSLVPANVYKQILQCNHSNSRERPGPDDVIACLDKTLRAGQCQSINQSMK